jgi:hypothetical protein
VFGSHLSEHTVLVGAVRDQLLRYGIELFVAHDTIEHDKLWQDEIERLLTAPTPEWSSYTRACAKALGAIGRLVGCKDFAAGSAPS